MGLRVGKPHTAPSLPLPAVVLISAGAFLFGHFTQRQVGGCSLTSWGTLHQGRAPPALQSPPLPLVCASI
jgi:hypothetical protein